MRPTFEKVKSTNIQESIDQSSALSFDSVENGSISYLSDDRGNRGGSVEYKQYVQKVGGSTTLATPSAATGGAKGGLMYIDPDETATGRSRIIYAYNNLVYLYDITSATNFLLRDIGTADSKTITYLSGEQYKSSGYFSIGDSTQSDIYVYSRTTKSITSVSDNGSGKARFNHSAGGFATGNTVVVSGFATKTTYNGTWTITNVASTYFDVAAVSYDGTDTGSSVAHTMGAGGTGAFAPRYISVLDNRFMTSGCKTNADRVQYSYVDTGGSPSLVFTKTTNINEGGEFSGSLDEITALKFYKGYGAAFEKNKITFHKITYSDKYGTGLVKDVKTIVDESTVDGVGVLSPKALCLYNERLYFVAPNKGLFEFSFEGGLKEITKPYRAIMKKFDFSNASICQNEKRNELIVTCGEFNGIADGFQLIYSLDSKNLSFASGKLINQVFWDAIGQKNYALGSAVPSVLDAFNDFYTDTDTSIELSAETRAYDMNDPYKKKRLVSFSQDVGVVNSTQTFTIEMLVDDNPSPVATITRNAGDALNASAQGSSDWGGEAWGGGNPDDSSGDSSIRFFTIFFRGFVPSFGKLFIRTKEKSPYKSVVHQPMIRWRPTQQKINSFDSAF